MPRLVILAGPNGCGKSTLTDTGIFDDIEIIDPDRIAREQESGHAISAGRIALRRRRKAIQARRSFVIETTLAGNGIQRIIKEAKEAGYKVELAYTCVNSADEALERIKARVAAGGHNIPEEDARRRFERSLKQLPGMMMEADIVRLYDNSNTTNPHREVARIVDGKTWTADNTPQWVEDTFRQLPNNVMGTRYTAEAESGKSGTRRSAQWARFQPPTKAPRAQRKQKRRTKKHGRKYE